MTTTSQRQSINPFAPAVKYGAKLRLALAGPSGSGKTYSGLAIATNLVGPGGRIAVIDTEHGSASKYADLFDFDVINMDAPFHPDRFIKLIEAAIEAGYDLLMIDSLTHPWSGPGGLLELKDTVFTRQNGGNSYAAWKDATPLQNRLIEAIARSDIHLIGCMRTKTEYVVEKDDRGKSRPRKVGTAPVQRDGFEYEFDVVGELDLDNQVFFDKSRCPDLKGQVFTRPAGDVAEILSAWLDGEQAPKKASPEKLKELAEVAKRVNISPQDLADHSAHLFGVTDSRQLSEEQVDELMEWCDQGGPSADETPSADELKEMLALEEAGGDEAEAS